MRQGSPSRPLIVGLSHHRLTEHLENSLATVFTGFERAVAGHTVRLIPSVTHSLPEAQKRASWVEFMRPCDVVIITDPLPLELRRTMGLRTRFVYVPLGELPRGGLNLRRALPFFEPGDVVAFSSRADLQVFGHMVASCAADVVLLPLFVDHTRFRPSTAEERRTVRASFGVNDEHTLFVYVGRVTGEKNVHGLLQVLGRVTATHPNVRLLVVGAAFPQPFYEFGFGPFSMKDILPDLVKKASMQDCVHFMGWAHPEVLPQVYGAADVMINLTLHHDENFGYAQAEAMSCEIPVISTDWGGLKDTVDHGRTGFRVPTWVTDWGIRIDVPAAVRYCRELADSPSLRQEMGRAGRQRVLDLFSEQAFNANMARLLAPAAPRPRAARENRFSAFGKTFHATFSAAPGIDGPCGARRKPVSPLYSADSYGLYRRLIGPYSSGIATPRFRADDVVFLARANASPDRRFFTSDDLLWPGRVRLTQAGRDVVQTLEQAEDGEMHVGALRKRLSLSAPKSRSVLGRLWRAGILGTRSAEPAEKTVSPEGHAPRPSPEHEGLSPRPAGTRDIRAAS